MPFQNALFLSVGHARNSALTSGCQNTSFNFLEVGKRMVPNTTGTLTKAKRNKAKQVNLTKAKRTKAKLTKAKHKVGST
jgi:hypothetical protein